MPELFFKGKEFVYKHHLAVPFRPLIPDPARSLGESGQAGHLDGNLIIHGDNLPGFDQLGTRLFHMATNAAQPVAAGPEAVAGSGYLGELPPRHVWLLYRPDLNFLKSRNATLTLSRAEAIVAAKPGKPHLVYTPARFVSQWALNEAGLPMEFAPLPFALYRVEKPQ